MFTGKVLFFDVKKGFGFIQPDEGEQALFVHFSSIQIEGFKKLKKNQCVRFNIAHNEKGAQATEVEVMIND